MSETQISCMNCKHQRCSGSVFICAYSTKYITRKGGQTQIMNKRLEECRKVKFNKSGKCFMHENWEPLTEKPKMKDVTKKCKESLRRTINVFGKIKIRRI